MADLDDHDEGSILGIASTALLRDFCGPIRRSGVLPRPLSHIEDAKLVQGRNGNWTIFYQAELLSEMELEEERCALLKKLMEKRKKRLSGRTEQDKIISLLSERLPPRDLSSEAASIWLTQKSARKLGYGSMVERFIKANSEMCRDLHGQLETLLKKGGEEENDSKNAGDGTEGEENDGDEDNREELHERRRRHGKSQVNQEMLKNLMELNRGDRLSRRALNELLTEKEMKKDGRTRDERPKDGKRKTSHRKGFDLSSDSDEDGTPLRQKSTSRSPVKKKTASSSKVLTCGEEESLLNPKKLDRTPMERRSSPASTRIDAEFKKSELNKKRSLTERMNSGNRDRAAEKERMGRDVEVKRRKEEEREFLKKTLAEEEKRRKEMERQVKEEEMREKEEARKKEEEKAREQDLLKQKKDSIYKALGQESVKKNCEAKKRECEKKKELKKKLCISSDSTPSSNSALPPSNLTAVPPSDSAVLPPSKSAALPSSESATVPPPPRARTRAKAYIRPTKMPMLDEGSEDPVKTKTPTLDKERRALLANRKSSHPSHASDLLGGILNGMDAAELTIPEPPSVSREPLQFSNRPLKSSGRPTDPRRPRPPAQSTEMAMRFPFKEPFPVASSSRGPASSNFMACHVPDTELTPFDASRYPPERGVPSFDDSTRYPPERGVPSFDDSTRYPPERGVPSFDDSTRYPPERGVPSFDDSTLFTAPLPSPGDHDVIVLDDDADSSVIPPAVPRTMIADGRPLSAFPIRTRVAVERVAANYQEVYDAACNGDVSFLEQSFKSRKGFHSFTFHSVVPSTNDFILPSLAAIFWPGRRASRILGCIRLLLRYAEDKEGASILEHQKSVVGAWRGGTALHIAAQTGKEQLARLLVQVSTVNVNEVDNRSPPRVAFCYSVERKDYSVASLLLLGGTSLSFVSDLKCNLKVDDPDDQVFLRFLDRLSSIVSVMEEEFRLARAQINRELEEVDRLSGVLCLRGQLKEFESIFVIPTRKTSWPVWYGEHSVLLYCAVVENNDQLPSHSHRRRSANCCGTSPFASLPSIVFRHPAMERVILRPCYDGAQLPYGAGVPLVFLLPSLINRPLTFDLHLHARPLHPSTHIWAQIVLVRKEQRGVCLEPFFLKPF